MAAGPVSGGPASGGGVGAGPAVPAGPVGPAAGRGGGGMAIRIERQKTSKQRLRMKWDYPVFVSEAEKALEESDSETVAVAATYALPREKALKFVTGADRRPILVLRECNFCNGTDDALLSRTESNERTLLLAQWFHCLKMPTHVLEENHPFKNLFEGDEPAHLFLASYDGGDPIALKGDQSRTELWDAMETVLGREYEGDAPKAVREITKILAEYDHIDSMQQWREQQLDAEIEKSGPDSSKVRKLKKELEKLAKQKAQAEKREKELWDLGLKVDSATTASK